MRPLPNPELNTAASTMYEWYCITTRDRIFIHSASSMESCIARLMEKGHQLKFIMELSEYEQLQADQQRAMEYEYNQQIEKGVA